MLEPGARVRCDSLSKHSGSVQPLRNFTLDVRAGEFLTILGASGSGKSTVLNALAGFSPATSGEIYINDRAITYEKPERRNIGMVFQNYSLFPHMNVLQNVAFPLMMRKVPQREREQKALQALEVVRLGELAHRMPKELSGGQQQRVAIARAIVFSPSLLLMDEPLGALDLKLREALQFEIKALQHKLNCTVIYVTHDQREALAMSDRIAVLRLGQIEQVGTPAEMYDLPKTRYVANFIGHTNLFEVKAAGGSVEIPELGISLPMTQQSSKPCVSIRPERFKRTDTPAATSVRATMEEVIFLGDVVECAARTDSGRTIHFKESRRDSSTTLARGQSIFLSLDPNDLVFVQDS